MASIKSLLSLQTSWWRMKNMFKRAVFGTGEYLSRTENIVHTLGCITALCCTDKKGILSWPNQVRGSMLLIHLSDIAYCAKKACLNFKIDEEHAIKPQVPERIFLVKKVPKPARQQTSNEAEASDFAAAGDDPSDQVSSEGRSPPAAGTSSASGFDLVPEILSVTHDPRNPFKVEFDDPSWQSYMNYLLPLGLSIVLNTCNISTEEKYTNFFNHLVCESVRVDGHGHAGKRSNIDVLPIVTRGCLCELARKIGFGPRTAAQYTLSSQIQVCQSFGSFSYQGLKTIFAPPGGPLVALLSDMGHMALRNLPVCLSSRHILSTVLYLGLVASVD